MQKTWGQYHLTAELAKKYSHSTYLASPTNLQRGHGEPEDQVVLTVYASSLFRLPREREIFLQKAQCIKDLQHRHLVPILDMGIMEEEHPFIAWKYLPNGSLRRRLSKMSPGRLNLRAALTIVLQIGQALVYAHEHNIVHGNLKPENILFDANDQAVLTDFSLVESRDAILRDQVTQEYAFCYLAPEQLAGSCDARSDQYALGCMVYELITGCAPPATGKLPSTMGSSSNPGLTLLSEKGADLSPSLKVALLKALAQDPAERFFDFSLFLEVIQLALSPLPTFPFLSSTSSPKKSAISHPVPSGKAEMAISPIRKRAASRQSQLSEAFSSQQKNGAAERVSAPPVSKASLSAQATPISLGDILQAPSEDALSSVLLAPGAESGYKRDNQSFKPFFQHLHDTEEIEPLAQPEDGPITTEEADDKLPIKAKENALAGTALLSTVQEHREPKTDAIFLALPKNTAQQKAQTRRIGLSKRKLVEMALLLSGIAALIMLTVHLPIKSVKPNIDLRITPVVNRVRVLPTPTALLSPGVIPAVALHSSAQANNAGSRLSGSPNTQNTCNSTGNASCNNVGNGSFVSSSCSSSGNGSCSSKAYAKSG